MIPNLSKDEIIHLSLSSKEKEHQSLNRIGYHVFISWYFDRLNQLSEHSKEEVLNEFLPNFPDNESIDSVLTPPLRALHVSIKMKAAAKMWKSLVGDQQHAWCLRANQLNMRNLPGVFKKIPQVLSEDGMDYNIRLSLQSDWAFLVKKLKRMIVCPPQKHLTGMSITFGKERVPLHSQSFGSFQLNYLIGLCIFGKDFNKIKKSELVYQSKRVTIIHISSIERLMSLLTLDGLSGVCFEYLQIRRHASPKVFLEHNGLEISGYVLSEGSNGLKIHTNQNEVIQCLAPKWIEAEHKYEFQFNEGGMNLKEFVPVRISVASSGDVKIAFHRFAISVDSGILNTYFTS